MTSVAPAMRDAGTPSASDAAGHRPRELVLAAVLVSCSPLVLLVFNRDWFLTSEGFLDPWNYVGFFREYLNPAFGRGAYKMGRLPWILSGFAVHKVFPPLWAAYVLHGVYFCVTTLALFAALYLLLGRLGLAAVVATLFGFYTQAHGAGGWDYHNTGAGAFYMLAVALLAWPAVIGGRRAALVLTGAVIAVTVHCNIVMVNLLPALAFIHVTVLRVRNGTWPRMRVMVTRSLWALLGAVLITIVLGLINMMAGREFLFFRVLVQVAFRLLSDPDQYQAPYWKPWASGWVWTARYLSLPVVVTCVGGVTLMLHRHAPTATDTIARALVLQFVATFLMFAAWQAAGQTALDWGHLAYPVTPASFIGLAGLFALRWPDACERRWLPVTLATVIVSAMYLSGIPGALVESVKVPAAPHIFLAGAVAFAASLLVYLSRSRLSTTIASVILFGFANTLIAAGPRRYYANDSCKIQPAIYEAIVDGASWLGQLDPTYAHVRTWFDETEQAEIGHGCVVNMRDVAPSITAMALGVSYVTAPEPMPGVDGVPEKDVRSLESEKAILAVISSRSEPLDQWNDRLKAIGLSHQELARHTVTMLGSEFALHAWRITQ